MSALALSEQLAESGKVLVAKPNTVLSELVRLSQPAAELRTDENASSDPYFEAVVYSTQGSLDSPSFHSLELDAIIDQISKTVTADISFAKNVVRPLVLEFAENLVAFKDKNSSKCASEMFNIICLEIPSLLKQDFFLDSLEYYKGKTPIKPSSNFSLGIKTEEELLTLIATGHAKTDKEILAWLSTLEADFLLNIWKCFFTAEQNSSMRYGFTDIDMANIYDKASYALAIHLIARKLYEHVDESAVDINLAVYKDLAVQYRDYSGAILASSILKMAMFNSSKTLVIELSPQYYTAKVNGDIYRAWLKEGGTPEVILGLIVDGEQISSQSLIDLKAKDLVSRWNSYCTFYKTDQANRSFDHLKKYLHSSFSTMLNTSVNEELGYIESHPNYYSTVKELLEVELDNLRTKDADDLHFIALSLIGKCRFYYTSAFDILNDINEAAKSNPNVDVREAALLAVINHISDYLADQIALVNG